MISESFGRLALAAGVSALFALAAWSVGFVRVSGALAGALLAALVAWALGAGGFGLLALFVVAGNAATRLGYRQKAARGLAEERGGRRGAAHAFANLGTAAVCAVISAWRPESPAWRIAFAGALATALADTVGSEAGKLWGRKPRSPLTGRSVAAGTRGAVSLPGTLAGVAAAALLATMGALGGLYPARSVAAITLAAFLGSLAESLISAATPSRPLLPHHALNFANTLLGASLAAWLG